MSCFLEILRCIVFCGQDEEGNSFNYTRNHRDHYAASAREDAGIGRRLLQSDPPPRSPAKPPEAQPSWRTPQRPPAPSARSTVVSGPADFMRSSSVSMDCARGWQDKRSPEKPPPSRLLPPPNPSAGPPRPAKASPSSPLLSKASPSSPLLSKASPSSPLLSKASPTPLPSAKAPPTSLSLPSSSKASPTLPASVKDSPSLPRSSNASPAALSSSKTAPPSPSLSSKAYPIRLPKAEYDDESPELSVTKQRIMLPRYEIPEHLKDLIKKNKVPQFLRNRLSPSTYADYFATLLYAEDFYIEKWSGFLLSKVTLELRSRAAFENAQVTKKMNRSLRRDKKDFIAFVIDAVPERRPFLLSRDFVFVRPSDKMIEPFKGILFRVVKSTLILVEFEDDFHAQHLPTKKYDVSFSFNRVCLKRAHHAISAAMDPSFSNILFPDRSATATRSSLYSPPPFVTAAGSNGILKLATSRILDHKGPLPYLIEGLRSTAPLDDLSDRLTSTGCLIQEATLQIYRTAPHCRILICAPGNRTCDALMRSLHNEIPKSLLFRANAAFRDASLVPDDIIRGSLFEGECFTCPPVSELQSFKVITSTFMSSFRLRAAGISADHFTHIFLVDASSAVEPEAVVPLVNLVGKKTVVVVTGSCKESPRWVRSDIGRRHGLKVSYFERLLERELYSSRDPKFITHLM